MKRQLILEDGSVFVGEAFGGDAVSIGEVVFHTGMSGYQEVLTDPSYRGQMVAFTYPLIGNYGINLDDFEGDFPSLQAVLVREYCETPSNFRSDMPIDEYLKQQNIPGLAGIDTRRLTRLIREAGALKAKLCGIEENIQDVIAELKRIDPLAKAVRQVSARNAYPIPGEGPRVVVVDFGVKRSILKELNKRNFDIIVVPYNTEAQDILRWNPDGVLLSNGPGDPKENLNAVLMIQQLLGKVPMFGICLGHQLFALANGLETKRLKFGHHGANHPVKDLQTGRVWITSQNHSFVVEEESMNDEILTVTHVSLNDGSVEGLSHKQHPAFSIQFHPEASPGPHDANSLFDRFLKMMAQFKKEGSTTWQNAPISKPSWLSVPAPL